MVSEEMTAFDSQSPTVLSSVFGIMCEAVIAVAALFFLFFEKKIIG
jgi:hypothetical protein